MIAAACALAAPTAALALTATRTQTPAHTPGPSTIYGRVALNGVADGCTGGRAGVTVFLDPTFRSEVTSATGEFVFTDVPHALYSFRVEPDCEPIPCYAQTLFQPFGDFAVTLCHEDCGLTVMPDTGVPGTVIDVSGYCYPAAGGPLDLYFDDALGGTAPTDADGLFRTSLIVPTTVNANFSHRVRAVVGGDERAVGYFNVRIGPEPCIGDCDGNFVVTVDELIRGVRAALGSAATPCAASDSTQDGTVTIPELIAAVGRLIQGCHAADLVPVGAQISRCHESCAAETEPRLFMNVCIANVGDYDATPFNIQQVSGGRFGAYIDGLAAGQQTCVELPFAGETTVAIDYLSVVPERDENNNSLPVPVGTACDVIAPPCTPTPTPQPTPT
jgi:hypothetical protein